MFSHVYPTMRMLGSKAKLNFNVWFMNFFFWYYFLMRLRETDYLPTKPSTVIYGIVNIFVPTYPKEGESHDVREHFTLIMMQ